MKELVYQVTHVTATLEGNVVHAKAAGTTRTGGWTEPELVPGRVDGDTITFDFVAKQPSGIVPQVITPISGEGRSGPLLPPFPTHAVVKAESDEKRVPIDLGAYAPPPAAPDRPTA